MWIGSFMPTSGRAPETSPPSSPRLHQSLEVAERPEVRQLVGVDDRADAPDLTAGDVERQHADQPPLGVEVQRSRATVDLDGSHLARNPCAPAEPLDHHACDAPAPAQRPRERGNLAAAVAGQRDVVSEERLETGEIALLGGMEELRRQFVALLARRLEAGPPLLDVAPGAGAELANVVLALAYDRRDLRVLVVEHVAKQQHGPLLGREALQQHQHRQRQRVCRLGMPGGIVVAVGDDRLWQPFAYIALAAGARRAQLVEREPGGYGRHERRRGFDLLAAGGRPMHPPKRPPPPIPRP